jgi:general secretion pathway protein I
MRRHSGFGLLEALVALVLLSSIGFTLLAWVQQNLDTVQRLRLFYAEQDARRTVAEWASSLNPMDFPNGETAFGGLRLHWEGEILGERVSQTGYPQGIGLHDVALYRLNVVVHRERESEPWFSESIDVVGYKRVRELGNPLRN